MQQAIACAGWCKPSRSEQEGLCELGEGSTAANERGLNRVCMGGNRVWELMGIVRIDVQVPAIVSAQRLKLCSKCHGTCVCNMGPYVCL